MNPVPSLGGVFATEEDYAIVTPVIPGMELSTAVAMVLSWSFRPGSGGVR